jgi:hypothetical protein
MLQTFILPAIRQLSGNEPFYSEQYGASPHYHQDARSYFDDVLLAQWIGRRGSVEYPPRSPDLTHLDFDLWRPLKDVAFRRKLQTFERLWEEIEPSCAAIPVDTLATVARALVRRTQKCLQANGGHIEQFFLFNVGRSHPILCVSNLKHQ